MLKKTNYATFFLALLQVPARAQLSFVFARGGNDVRTFVNLFQARDDSDWSSFQSVNSVWNVISILSDNDVKFEGTVFLPLDETFEELQNSPVHRRILEDEAFNSHLNRLLFNHLVPGGEIDVSEMQAEPGLELQTAVGETIDANSILPTIVRSDINTISVMGHVVDQLIVPSFWNTSVRDIVGNPTLLDEEVYTVYLPPILEVADCSTFWEAHILMDEVAMEPAVEVLETIYANNGIVHRIAQPFPYDPCTTEVPTSEPTNSPTATPTGLPTNGPTSSPTRKVLTEDTLPSLPATGSTPSLSPTLSPVAAAIPTQSLVTSTNEPTSKPSSRIPVQPVNNGTSEGNLTEERNYIPLIAGISVASCLIAIGCVLGLLFFGQKGKRQTPEKQTSGLPSNFFDDPTMCPDPEQDAGMTLNPSIQEPSVLTLPTFLDNYNSNDK